MKKKLLFIRYKINDGIAEGGTVLTQTNLNIIRDILGTTQVDEYAIHNIFKKKPLVNKFQSIFPFFKGMFYGITSQRLSEIQSLSLNYDIIYIDRSIFGIIAKFLKMNGFKGQIITFFHNFEPIYYKDKVHLLNPFRFIVLNCVRKNEQWACAYSDKIIALHQRDNQHIKNHYQRFADILIPISFKDKYTPSETQKQRFFENPPAVLFFGTNFPANTEGLLWFVKEVLPHVNIRLQIVGKGMEKTKHLLPNSCNIELCGTVTDLTPFLENADFMIMPIFKGSGMKVKTCEAMMYGKTIVGTTETFTGYDVDFKKIGALANTKEEFIEAIEYLSQTSNRKYNAYSRNFFLQNHSDEVIKRRFEEILN